VAPPGSTSFPKGDNQDTSKIGQTGWSAPAEIHVVRTLAQSSSVYKQEKKLCGICKEIHQELTLLQRKSSAAVQNYHQLQFLNRCRYTTADNPVLSGVVLLERLLISIINSGSRTAANNKY
jgi:hypothetical protein